MSNLINKSNHPVEVKKIHVRIWTLRDEIEAAIEKRIKDEPVQEGESVDIEDIKEYYHNIIGGLNQIQNANDDENDEEPDSNVDSSGNPLDDDALAMMAAISGDSQDEETETKDEETEAKDEETEAKEDEEDKEAAAAALAMMADQGLTPESESSEDDEAQAAALAMMADQGLGEESSDDDAQAAALAMLADQAPTQESSAKRAPFERLIPKKEKRTQGFIMLSDIQMDQILIFSKDGFVHGQNIVIQFMITNKFRISANVKVATNISRNSKIISETRPNYRIQGILLFQFPDERDKLREFLKSIEPEIPTPPKKVKSTSNEDEDDDFDDLGF